MKLPKYYEDMGQTFYRFIKTKRKVPIKGIKNMEYADLRREIEKGERFVVFQYSIFLLFIFIRGISSIYFRKKSFRAYFAKIRYIILSSFFLVGAIFYFSAVCISGNLDFSQVNAGTIFMMIVLGVFIAVPIPAIITNLKGGIDVTDDVLAFIEKSISEEKTKISL